MNMRTKDRTLEVRKSPNMTWEASLTRSRISLISAGSATIFPHCGQQRQKFVVKIGDSRTRRPSKQLILQNLHRVKPIQRLRPRAICNALADIALAKSPQAYAVEIMKANGLGNSVDKNRVRDRGRYYMREVEV